LKKILQLPFARQSFYQDLMAAGLSGMDRKLDYINMTDELLFYFYGD
jgi:hypothetical protein